MSPARPRLEDLLAPELKPYLYYSLAAHAALAFLALRILGAAGSAAKSSVYTIDFVGGPASVITSAGPSASAPPAKAPSAPPKPGPSAEFDEFGRRKGRKTRFVLPRPSLLRGAQAPKPREEEEEKPAAPEGKAATGAAGGQTGAPGDAGGAGVSADMPNFPYPWYITQVRQMLWQRWQARMPSSAGESVVVFSIMPNGSVVDLRTETSSGDGSFDLAALAAVQDASPYPPLPAQFSEPFLKVHVTLRSQ